MAGKRNKQGRFAASDTTPERNEVAGTGGDFLRQATAGGVLLNPDDVMTLIAPGKLGRKGDLQVDHYALHRIMRRMNLKYGSQMETRKTGVLAKEIRIVPNPDDPDVERAKAVADFCSAALRNVGNFYSDLCELLDAIPQGFAVSELMWEQREVSYSTAARAKGSAGEKRRLAWVVTELKQRRNGRFAFHEDGSLRYQPRSGQFVSVDDWKFVVHSHAMENENRYGTAMSAECFWYVYIGSNSVKWWSIFNEKFSMPTVVVKYPPGAKKEDQEKALKAGKQIQTEYGVAIPNNFLIEYLEAKRGGQMNSYGDFCDWIERCLSERITGQSLATGQGEGGTGSYAQAAVHGAVKQEYIEADAKALMATLNPQLMAPLVGVNFGWDVPPALLQIDYEAKDLGADLKMDSALVNEIGLPLGEDYFYEKYRRPKPDEGAVLVSGRAVGSLFPTTDDTDDTDGNEGEGEYGDESVANNSRKNAGRKKAQKAQREQRDYLTQLGGRNFFKVSGKRQKEAARSAREVEKLAGKIVELGRAAHNKIADEVEKLANKSEDLGELKNRVEQLRGQKKFVAGLADAIAMAKVNGYLFGAAQIQRQLASDVKEENSRGGTFEKVLPPGPPTKLFTSRFARENDLNEYEPLPPKKAIEWFDELVPMTTEDLQRTYREALAKAFVVAGIEEKDVLNRIHEAISDSLKNGGTLAEWKSKYAELRIEAGLDPVKGYQAEQLYRDSTHRAYGAGRVRATRDPEIKEHLMGYQYVAIMDDRTRPEHAALNGFVAEMDDSFWQSHYPPWEYGCRCVAVPVTKMQAEREGIEPSGTVEIDGDEIDPRTWPASPGFRGLGFSQRVQNSTTASQASRIKIQNGGAAAPRKRGGCCNG